MERVYDITMLVETLIYIFYSNWCWLNGKSVRFSFVRSFVRSFYCEIIGPKVESKYNKWYRSITFTILLPFSESTVYTVYVYTSCSDSHGFLTCLLIQFKYILNQIDHSTVLFSWIRRSAVRTKWQRARARWIESESVRFKFISAKYPNEKAPKFNVFVVNV